MSRVRLLVVGALALLAGIVLWSASGLHGAGPARGVVVAGGDGGGLPRATPTEEGFDPAALAAVGVAARAAQALLVLRHGHLVLEQYAPGASADALVAGGALSDAALALLAGIALREHGLVLPGKDFDADALAAALPVATGQAGPQLLAHALWQPLNAAPARWVVPPGAGPGCCLEARAGDWLRLAALLLDGGSFEGTQVVAGGWVQGLRSAPGADPGRGYGVWLAPAASGAEPFAAPDVLFLRGPGRTRLWMMPTLDLAVLLVDDTQPGAPYDETRLPNQVIRALGATGSAHAAGLDSLVVGH